eukprot:8161635-Lingulodinium_polyedra.AAC.1
MPASVTAFRPPPGAPATTTPGRRGDLEGRRPGPGGMGIAARQPHAQRAQRPESVLRSLARCRPPGVNDVRAVA